MASISRAARKALAVRGSALKTPTSPIVVSHCINHSEDSRKHPPYLLQRRQLAQTTLSYPQSQPNGNHLGNISSNNYILHLRLATAHPSPKCHLSTKTEADLDVVKRKLQGITVACISYKQLLQICIDCTQNSCENDGIEIINLLKKSGTILYLQPEQVVRAVKSVLPLYVDDSCREELRILDKEKAEIDLESERLVRKELWCGLGFFSLMISFAFRLTFWELSWEVTEPIYYFYASVYCLTGYAFFLKTARNPTFESFYAVRLKTKQKKVMKKRHFNIERYRELQRICHLCTKDLDVVKRKLQGITDAYISYKQLLDICIDCTQKSCEDDVIETINFLEKSGPILQIGDTLYLHPEQVVRAMKNVLPLYMDDSCREELRTLEREKAEIDLESERRVRKELWCGLGLFSLKIALAFRLSFLELSWNQVSPICFFVAYFYWGCGYAFFLKTARDLTFENFYAVRLKTKQKKLMKKRNFNLERYRELQRIWRQN